MRVLLLVLLVASLDIAENLESLCKVILVVRGRVGLKSCRKVLVVPETQLSHHIPVWVGQQTLGTQANDGILKISIVFWPKVLFQESFDLLSELRHVNILHLLPKNSNKLLVVALKLLPKEDFSIIIGLETLMCVINDLDEDLIKL